MKLKAQDFIKNHGLEIGDHLASELATLISSGEYFPYINNRYSDNKENCFNVYGDFKNNRLYMTLSRDSHIYYGRVNSGVHYPKMIDRKFGMDNQDGNWCERLGDVLCYVYAENHTLDEWIESANKL